MSGHAHLPRGVYVDGRNGYKASHVRKLGWDKCTAHTSPYMSVHVLEQYSRVCVCRHSSWYVCLHLMGKSR